MMKKQERIESTWACDLCGHEKINYLSVHRPEGLKGLALVLEETNAKDVLWHGDVCEKCYEDEDNLIKKILEIVLNSSTL